MPRYVNLDEEKLPIRGFKFTDYSGDMFFVEVSNISGDISVCNNDTGFNFTLKAVDAKKLSEALRRMVSEVEKDFKDDDEF